MIHIGTVCIIVGNPTYTGPLPMPRIGTVIAVPSKWCDYSVCDIEFPGGEVSVREWCWLRPITPPPQHDSEPQHKHVEYGYSSKRGFYTDTTPQEQEP